jgi:6-phosphogluconolactonase (cycloisomerase 2 family)
MHPSMKRRPTNDQSQRLRPSARTILTLVGAMLALAGVPAGASAATSGNLFDVYSVAMAPDGNRVYAGQGLGSPYVALSRDPSTGLLSFLPRPTFPGSVAGAGGEFRRTIAVSVDSKAVYDTKNGENALRQMSVTDTSLAHRRTYANYDSGITGMSGPQVVGASPDGRCVYVTAVYSYPGSIVAFRRDATTNDLTYDSTFTGSAYEYWNEMAFTDDGRFLYVANGSGVTVLDRDPSNCALSATQPAGAASGQVTGLTISPGNKHLYAIDPFGKRIFVFARDTSTGAVTLTQTITQGVAGAAGLDGVRGIVVSSDGKNVYTVAETENALGVWSRNDTTGDLSPQTVVRNGDALAGSLARAQTLVISPDGTSIYVGASGPTNAVSAFRRDPATGNVTFLQKVTDADGPGYGYIPPPGTGATGGGPGSTGGTGSGGPAPPPGPTGVSINDGARYTNNRHVDVSVVWPVGAAALSIANDGGFKVAQTISVAKSVPWKLDSSGPERLPKTIYVRFGTSTQTFTDDIILDQTKPTVGSASIERSGATSTSAAVAQAATSQSRTYRVRIGARDATSGVAKVQFAELSKRHPSAPSKFKRVSRFRGTHRPKYVRVQDRAGNYSGWRAIR